MYKSVNRIITSRTGQTPPNDLSPAESPFGTVLPNPPGVVYDGLDEPLALVCSGPEPLPNTAEAPVDLSLLGPGETPPNVIDLSKVVAPVEESQVLSSKIDTVQGSSVRIKIRSSSPKAPGPPKTKRLRGIPPNPLSLDEESGSSRPTVADGQVVKLELDTGAAEQDKQKSWHCVRGKIYEIASGLESHRAHSIPCTNGLHSGEAATVGAAQRAGSIDVDKPPSLLPLLSQSMSSRTNSSAQSGRGHNSDHEIPSSSFSASPVSTFLGHNNRHNTRLFGVPASGLWSGRGSVENESESAASPSLLPLMRVFCPPRSSSASDLPVSETLETSVNENHDLVQGNGVSPSTLGSASPTLRHLQELFEPEETDAVADDLSDRNAGTVPGTLHANGVGRNSELSSASVMQPQPSSESGENTKPGTLAQRQQYTPSVSCCANLQISASQSHLSSSIPVTVSNNNYTSTSTEILPHHTKALAQTLPENKIEQSSQLSISRRKPRRGYKSVGTADKMTPSLRPRVSVEYYRDTPPSYSEPPTPLLSTPVEGLMTGRRQPWTNTHTAQPVEQHAGRQHVTQQQTVVQLSYEVLDSMLRLSTPSWTGCDVWKERPYLSLRKQGELGGALADSCSNLDLVKGFKDTIIHMDFVEDEYEELVQAVYKTIPSVTPLNTKLSARMQLVEILQKTSKEDQLTIRKYACRHRSLLWRRNKKHIKALLQDASHGTLPEHSKILLVTNNLPHPPQRHLPHPIQRSTASLLRNRQFGIIDDRGSTLSAKAANRELRTRLSEGLAPWKSWNDASNDVLVVAWSPNGSTYAVGASAQTDPASAQYNKRHNLLLGDIDSNTLRELPDHHVARPIPREARGTQWDLYNACDPILQTSVTATRFSIEGDRMFTASYDRTVKVWDVSQRGYPVVVDTLEHDAEVELAAISGFYSHVLATGSKTREGSIRVYSAYDLEAISGVAYKHSTFSSFRALKYPGEELHPSSLQWGTTWETSHLLLAGFSPKGKDNTEDPGQTGEVCLWDLEQQQAVKLTPSSQNVFEAVWHPNLPIFATGSTPLHSNKTYPKTRSIVRTYEPLRSAFSTVEYECPALDMNDVTFAPYNVNYISAGCTDGITYVWDYRMPDKVMLQLQHGEPLAERHPFLSREQHDTGIRFTAWDGDGQYLYTGSSDGFIKAWDIRRAPEDTLVRDVAQLQGGVMCGVFSPDYSNLLVGDDTGAIQILSTAPTGQRRYTEDNDYEEADVIAEEIPFVYAPQNQRSTTAKDLPQAEEEVPTCHGTMIAAGALATGELSLHPVFGAGRGPNYSGPYCLEARFQGATEDNAQTVPLLPNEQAQQLDKNQREMAKKRGGKAKQEELEITKEQVKIAWLRNVNVELTDHWGENYVDERDKTLVKLYKEGKDVVQYLKQLKLQHNGRQDADVTNLREKSSGKHLKEDEESDLEGVVRKKSMYRHSKGGSDEDLVITHEKKLSKPPIYRQIGKFILLDDDSDDEGGITTSIEKHYDARDAWLPREQDLTLFEDAEESWFTSRAVERELVRLEVLEEEARRLAEEKRLAKQKVRAAEAKRKAEEARAKLLAEVRRWRSLGRHT